MLWPHAVASGMDSSRAAPTSPSPLASISDTSSCVSAALRDTPRMRSARCTCSRPGRMEGDGWCGVGVGDRGRKPY